MKVALLKCTVNKSIVCNCRTCKYGIFNPYRQLPICKLGTQLDCIQDNYDHWALNDAIYQNVEVIGYKEEEE